MKISANHLSFNHAFFLKQASKCYKSQAFGSSKSEFLRQIEKKDEFVKDTFLKKAKEYERETQEPILMSEQMHTNHSGYEQILYARDMYGDIVKEYVVTKDPNAINTLCVDDITEDKKGVFEDGELIVYQEGISDEDGEAFTKKTLLLNGNKPDSYSENEIFEQDDSGEFSIRSDFELLYDTKGRLSNCFIDPVRYNSNDYYPDDFEYDIVYSGSKPIYIYKSPS